MRVVVTGCAGFIGSHVADAFLARGDEVLAIDDLSTGSRENVPPRARFERLDIVDAELLRRSVADFRPEVVCHLAAQSSVTVSVTNPRRDLDVNVAGTFNVCEAAKDVGARVVFASTGGALYGDRAPVPTMEDFPPEPLAPYGASKLAGESYVSTWGRLHGLPNVVLRLANIYGPRQNPHGEAGVVAIFSDRLLRGEPPVVYGEGSPTRDYLHVSDLADAFVRSATGPAGTFNVGTGTETSTLELLEILRHASGNSVVPHLEPLRRGELQRSALESSRIAGALEWRPRVPLDQGLAETYRWYAEVSQ
jgi:UDP-glucose 4-epimerase